MQLIINFYQLQNSINMTVYIFKAYISLSNVFQSVFLCIFLLTFCITELCRAYCYERLLHVM
jgi:hypothetical protein